jgi:hypothetical protein
MKKSQFTDEQMISFIKQADSGLPMQSLKPFELFSLNKLFA